MRRETVQLVRQAVSEGRRAYVLVNNRSEGNAPLTVQALTEMLVNKGPVPFGAEPSASDREAGRQGWGGCQPFPLSEACSLYCAPRTVHARENPSRVREGDQGDVIVYRLPGPDDGGIGPCQQPVRWATGLSSVGHHTVNSPFITRTSTMSALAMVWL